MANSAQAAKRARQATKRREHNVSMRSAYRTAVKQVKKAVQAGDVGAAETMMQKSMSVMDAIADKRIVHKNKASRHKSRLAHAIKMMSQKAAA